MLPPSLMVYLSPNWSFSGDKWSAVENAFTKWWILQKQICVRMYGFDTGHKSKCENRVSLSFIHITYRWGCSITSACIFPITEPYFGSLLASYCVFDILVDGQIRQSIFALLPHSHSLGEFKISIEVTIQILPPLSNWESFGKILTLEISKPISSCTSWIHENFAIIAKAALHKLSGN